jgi:hypothetical protein
MGCCYGACTKEDEITEIVTEKNKEDFEKISNIKLSFHSEYLKIQCET